MVASQVTINRGIHIDVKSEDAKRPKIQRSLWKQARRFVLKKIFTQSNLWFDQVDVFTSPRPKTVGSEINNTCNAKCSFCGYGKGSDGKAADPRKKSMLDITVFRHTLQLYSEGGGGVFSLSPILGEVTTDKRWLDLVREVRSYPNITGASCFTNGILLHKFGMKNIVTSGLTHINISTALGSREQYKRLYGVDKYDQVVDNIINLLQANNEMGKPVNIDLLLRLDKPFDAFLNSELYSKLCTIIELEKIKILDDFWDDFKGVIAEDGLPIGHTFKQPYDSKRVPCYAPFRKLTVMTDGTMQACACRVEPDLWVGNIQDFDSLKDAWHAPKLEILRSNWLDGKIPDCCHQCSHYIPYTNLIFKFKWVDVFRQLARNIKRTLRKK